MSPVQIKELHIEETEDKSWCGTVKYSFMGPIDVLTLSISAEYMTSFEVCVTELNKAIERSVSQHSQGKITKKTKKPRLWKYSG